MKKILFIASYRLNRAPSQRFRFEQYLEYLSHHGFECHVSPLIASGEEDRVIFESKNLVKKIMVVAKIIGRRLQDVWRSREYDLIFVSREAFKTGSIFFEKQFRRSRAKMIFDFDDAVWINAISKNNKIFRGFKDASKTASIIGLADLVFAGNDYLSNYAKKFNPNVVIIPTTIDTDIYRPPVRQTKNRIVVGWSGSVTTIQHFEYAVPALKILKEKYKDRIEIKVIGDANYRNSELNITGLPWRFETEIEDLSGMDIGLMPLPDNEWTWGKCGLKGLQYMALEIPTVMSPVGVNTKIITDGKNGYLADTTAEWVEKIGRLIESEELRKKLGQEGRKTVVDEYSFISQRDRYVHYFNALIDPTQ